MRTSKIGPTKEELNRLSSESLKLLSDEYRNKNGRILQFADRIENKAFVLVTANIGPLVALSQKSEVCIGDSPVVAFSLITGSSRSQGRSFLSDRFGLVPLGLLGGG